VDAWRWRWWEKVLVWVEWRAKETTPPQFDGEFSWDLYLLWARVLLLWPSPGSHGSLPSLLGMAWVLNSSPFIKDDWDVGLVPQTRIHLSTVISPNNLTHY
jgi:hypothetical protein